MDVQLCRYVQNVTVKMAVSGPDMCFIAFPHTSAHTSAKEATKRDSGAFMKMHLSSEVAAPRGLPLKTFMGEETD